MLLPRKLSLGDTIGIVSPCDVKYPEKLKAPIAALERLGFSIKLGEHIFSDTWGYAASARERADDFNSMATDDEVGFVFFGGGDVGNEVLPLLDYDAIGKSGKIFCSYSDSTSILNAITANTGLVTFHGQTPRTFENLSEYNSERFFSVLANRDVCHRKAAPWTTLHGGTCCGKLLGGYTQNVCFLLSSPYFRYEKKEHILFLEDYFWFSEPVGVARYLEHIMQSEFFNYVGGVIFGGYGEGEEAVLEILARKSQSVGIPFVKCSDFGHGENNAIFPIGANGVLDADKQELTFLFE